MAIATLYNSAGEDTGKIELNDAIFAVEPNQVLVHQVYVALRANDREAWAHSKDRSQVSGGGKKPWKQKGTGRARHGSIRSPIWRGGGITFGPLNLRNYKQKINKKMSLRAVKMCLSDKIKREALLVVDQFADDGKTKTYARFRKKMPGYGKTTLLLSDRSADMLERGVSNVSKLDIKRAMDVNVMDLLDHQFVIINKSALDVLEKRLLK
ncbi:MAG: 50S ribosomal protein L4 [Candidatus Magasanikbacteria bacterium]|nr:50S ribosomal protein L4 [Candidatus Magasanikbacteria bacterium]